MTLPVSSQKIRHNEEETHPIHRISLHHFLRSSSPKWQRAVASVLDVVTGIRQLNRLYHQHHFAGLPVTEFLSQLRTIMKWQVRIADEDLARIPSSGPVILVANHPYGGLEGVLLASILTSLRSDVKILANQGLQIFPELAPCFIFTNPLKPSAQGNLTSLRQCHKHVAAGGLLVVFPAGRVSYPQTVSDLIAGRIYDHPWDRFAVQLSQQYQCPIQPVFVEGQNRQRFYSMGLLHYRFRLLMLVRELLASQGQTTQFYINVNAAIAKSSKDASMQIDTARLLTYLQDPRYRQNWPAEQQPEFADFAPPQLAITMIEEIDALPTDQRLVQYKHFEVCVATQKQCPAVVEEIRRLREVCFREFDEGSGQPQDGDSFDAYYLQLFIFDRTSQQIIGAYRMGPTDQILSQHGVGGLYLSRMFAFSEQFINRRQPCLEMGRSFVVRSQQKSFHALLLLFRGIAAFVTRNPQYQILYGTVSLSKQYNPLSVWLMSRVLATPSEQVKARCAFAHPEHPELSRFLSEHTLDIEELDQLIRQIEPDGKGLPVLVRQYHQLGARFYTVGIDPNFASTPGFLLSVDLKEAPYRQLKLFFGDALSEYLGMVTSTVPDSESGSSVLAVDKHGAPA